MEIVFCRMDSENSEQSKKILLLRLSASKHDPSDLALLLCLTIVPCDNIEFMFITKFVTALSEMSAIFITLFLWTYIIFSPS